MTQEQKANASIQIEYFFMTLSRQILRLDNIINAINGHIIPSKVNEFKRHKRALERILLDFRSGMTIKEREDFDNKVNDPEISLQMESITEKLLLMPKKFRDGVENQLEIELEKHFTT